MSVSEPADSGGIVTSLSQDLQGFEDMSTVGAWAKMMEEDVSCSQMNSTIDEEEEPERSVETEGKKLPDRPPFSVQVTNVASSCDEMDVYFEFGGEKRIKCINVNPAAGKADIEFFDREGLLHAIQKNGTELCNKKLKVYVIDHSRERRPAQIDRSDRTSSARDSRDSYGGRSSRDQRDYREQFHRGSHHGSQNSIYSDDPRSYNNQRNNYATLPRHSTGGRGGRHHDDRYGQSFRGGPNYNARGGYQNRGGGGGGGYRHSMDRPRQSTNEYKRSDSGYEYEKPAPINRSRTESTTSEQAERRRLELTSRNSSRLSINTFEDERPQPVKKPSSRDIFGDAKPVDTADKIREIEEKQEREKKIAAERERERVAREKEREREVVHPSSSQQQQQQNHFVPPAPGFDPSKPPPHNHGYMRGPKIPQQVHQVPIVNQPPRFDGSVGSVAIMKRDDRQKEKVNELETKDHNENHNNLEPRNSSENLVKKEERVASSASSSNENQGAAKKSTHVRTFTRTLQKSATSDQINENRSYRGGRGGGRGRGGHQGRGSIPSDRRSSYSSQQDVSRDKIEVNAPVHKPEKKEHHSSQVSLRSNRGNHKRHDREGRGGYYGKDRQHKEEGKPPRDDTRQGKDHNKSKSDVPKDVKSEEQKPQNATQHVQESKERPHKESQKPPAVPVAVLDLSASNEDSNNKKKDKKKVKKESAKVGKSLKGNKFAALANVDD
ncbi:unnamed protein product [Auanema sp. JU1783]|nr:unnamed protein product [Auanema sp. JU1783]